MSKAMNNILFFFFLLFTFFLQIKSQIIPNNISIFILAGQSNMAGRGGVYNNTATNTTVWDGLVPRECKSNPLILRFTEKLQWEVAKEPLHIDIDFNKTNGIGPGMSFANRLVLNRFGQVGGQVGLVPCSIGGTKLSQWQKGEVLYEKTLRRAKAAVASGGGLYGAVLWYQGESDTVDMVDASVYKMRLVKLFNDLRSDLDQPNLPIIQVALASGKGPYLNEVRKAQLETKLENVHCVDAMGLPLEPDGLHLTTSSQVKLGHMMVDAYLAISNSAKPSPLNGFYFLVLLLSSILLQYITHVV